MSNYDLEYFSTLTKVDQLTQCQYLRPASCPLPDRLKDTIVSEYGQETGNRRRTWRVIQLSQIAAPENRFFKHGIKEWNGELGVSERQNLYFEPFV